MKTRKIGLQFLVYWLIFLMAIPPGAFAQDTAESEEAPQFTDEELAQMLAPIALYPDTLLAQLLMASTYPLEVVQAARWIEKNPDLKGDSLDAALIDQEWDVSVKSMTHFADILNKMSERVEETSRLGDAFLAQEGDVMDMIQELRTKAKAEGNLESSQEQKVVVEEKYIVIESTNPEVIYVPTYSPTVVYGTWWYPASPPYRPYYPYYPGTIAVAFTAGIIVGAAVGGWCRFGWRSRSVNVNINRTANFNRNVNRGGGNQKWQHNPKHRKGVAYKDRGTSKRYGQSPSRSKEARRDTRGYDRGGQGGKGRDTARRDADRGNTQRDRTGNKGAGSLNKSGSGSRGSTTAGSLNKGRSDRSQPGAQVRTRDKQRTSSGKTRPETMSKGSSSKRNSSAFGGASSRSSSSRASQRGQTSRRSSGGRGGGRR